MAFFNIEKTNKNNQNTFFNQNPNMMGNNQPDMYNNQPDMYNNQGMMNNNMNPGFGQVDYNQGMNPQNDMGYNPEMNGMNPGFGPTDYNSGIFNTNNVGFNQNMNQQNDMGYPQGMDLPSMNNSQTMEIPVMNNNQGMGSDGSSYLPPKPNIPPAPSLYNNDSPKMNNGPVIKPGGQGELAKFEDSTNNSTIVPNNMGGELSKYEGSDAKKESSLSIENNKNDSQSSLEGETKNTLDYYNNKDIKKEEAAEGIAHEDIETLEIEEVQLPREIEKEMELSGGLKKKEPKDDKNAKEEKAIDNSEKDFANQILSSMDKYQDVEDIGEQKDVKANIFAAFGIILGMIVKPGTTMLKNAKKFKKIDKAGFIMLWLAVIFLIVCIVVRIGVGSFDRSYSSLSDSYKLVFNPGRIFELSNYLEFLLISVSLSVGGVLLVALIYYASSFMNSKGVHFATYLIIANLAMIPLLVGAIVLYPVAVIFSGYLGLGALIFSFLATLITLLIGMNEVLTFKSINNQIFYHVINLSVITLVAVIVFVFMVQKNWIILPVMNI